MIKCTLIRLLAWINSLYISGGSVFKNFRYPFFALLVFALTVSWLVYGSWNFRSEAGPPAYWITVADSELEHISSLNAVGFNVVERRSGLAIAKVDELQLADLSRAMHTEFHKCAGFIRHETYDEALKSVNESLAATTESQFVAYSIDNQSAVTPMLAEAQEPRIRQTITELSALPNRRHDQQGGTDGANYIYSKWRLLALGRNDISVYPYAHQSPTNPDVFLTPQPSIIMSIQGTEFPNEIVVVGGHQDSINSSGGATGVAPGADDDASGIASITETIRVLIAKGFRPKRTVQFMAYAAEEVGLVGSKNIAENYRAQNKNVIGVVQLDMTNFAGTWADIVLMTDNTNAAQNQFLRDLVAAYQPSLVVKNDVCGYGCSDHKSWHDKLYPASMPFEAKFSGTTLDGIPRQYNTMIHTTSDTLSRSNNNADHALKFTKLAVSFVGELAKGSIAQVPVRSRFDFDGDGESDISVFRPGVGVWHLNRSTAGYTASQFGVSTDVIVPADYDGDGRADVAVYRDGVWHLLRSQAGYTSVLWGTDSDVPQSGDFDGDGTDDLAVFRPSNGTWYIKQSSAGELVVPFGADGDRPVASDYDGDGKTDPAVYRDGIWHLLRSTSGYAALQFGVASDRPITGDFDGDGKSDPVVYRDGFWHTLGSAGGYSVVQWGIASDRPSAGDFDGDGKMDISVFREGTWYILNSSNGSARFEQFGTVNDVPTESAYIQ